MERTVPVSALFREEPFRRGHPGDPHLGREMRERLSAVARPAAEAEPRAHIEVDFPELTGIPVSHGEPMYIETYSHGGMSGGYVSPEWWRDTALPLLVKRYPEITGA